MAQAAAFFRRFRHEDPEAARKEIETHRAKLVEALRDGDDAGELDARIALGFCLTPLDCESEAVSFLEPALELARRTNDRKRELATLLHLGTALQYLGDRERALRLFQQGLDRGKSCGIAEFESVLLHHRGRCRVEQGRLADARRDFEEALRLREAEGQERPIRGTKAALAELDRMEGRAEGQS